MAMGRYYQSKQFGEGAGGSPKAGHHKTMLNLMKIKVLSTAQETPPGLRV